MSTSLLEPATPSQSTRRRPAPTRRLTLNVTVDEHAVVTVHVKGHLDIYTVTRLRQRMARFDLSEGRLVLDVSQVTLIDSSGLGTLLSFANRGRSEGRRIPLICTPELAGVLQIARLADAFDVTVIGEAGSPRT